MILIDSNIPMYLVGAEHPHKFDAQRLLERAIYERQKLVTDAEVLQEILHRYVAIDRRDAIQPAPDSLLGVVDGVLSIEERDVLDAHSIELRSKAASARDALHIAVMRRHGIESIMTFDRGFDAIPGVTRVS